MLIQILRYSDTDTDKATSLATAEAEPGLGEIWVGEWICKHSHKYPLHSLVTHPTHTHTGIHKQAYISECDNLSIVINLEARNKKNLSRFFAVFHFHFDFDFAAVLAPLQALCLFFSVCVYVCVCLSIVIGFVRDCERQSDGS